MVYGPFDLSDATEAEVSFWLWREFPNTLDYLVLEASYDGVSFQELARWNTTNTNWQLQSYSLNSYKGDNSVWVAWRFYSNSSITADGPWVDDIVIRKYLPGQVTVTGSLNYYNRNGQRVPAPNVRVIVNEIDLDSPGGTDVFGTTTTATDGSFTLGPFTNWDTDETALDPLNRRLDLMIVWQTVEASRGQHWRSRCTLFLESRTK